MQFMICTRTDSVAGLRSVAQLLLNAADERESETVADDPADIFGKQPGATPPSIEEQLAAGIPAPPAMPPVPPAGDPPPPAAPTTPPTGGDAPLAELDSEGQPWNPNLHARTKTKTKDGKWKKRRGGPVTTATPPADPPPAAVPPAPATPPPAPATPPAAPAAPPPAPAAAATEAADGVPTFRSLVAKIATATTAGKITADRVKQLCEQAGAPDLTTLNAMPDLVPVVDAMVDAELVGK